MRKLPEIHRSRSKPHLVELRPCQRCGEQLCELSPPRSARSPTTPDKHPTTISSFVLSQKRKGKENDNATDNHPSLCSQQKHPPQRHNKQVKKASVRYAARLYDTIAFRSSRTHTPLPSYIAPLIITLHQFWLIALRKEK